jgi:hypothetical protein
MTQSNVSNSKVFFLSRNHTRLGSTGDEAEHFKDPLGLNTLYDPPDLAIADLIFVHGLRGGSRSTWTKSADPSLYWPKEWLPKDAGFQDVRIHSFGYDSHWEKESSLNIYDFAQSLLGCIHDCPSMPRYSKVRIFRSLIHILAKSSILT